MPLLASVCIVQPTSSSFFTLGQKRRSFTVIPPEWDEAPAFGKRSERGSIRGRRVLPSLTKGPDTAGPLSKTNPRPAPRQFADNDGNSERICAAACLSPLFCPFAESFAKHAYCCCCCRVILGACRLDNGCPVSWPCSLAAGSFSFLVGLAGFN